MDENSQNQAPSIVSRIFSAPLPILLVGLFLVGSGIYTGDSMQLFFGGTIICGAVALFFVRKKDWKKHWEEQEQMQQTYEDRKARNKEIEDKKRGEQ